MIIISERDEKELIKLQDNLRTDKTVQQKKFDQIKAIADELEKIANAATERYQNEVRALEPEGQRMMTEVIEPWFLNLVSSGTYDDLLEWAKTHDDTISLSGSILYYWPRSALSASRKSLLDTSKFIVEESLTHLPLQEAIRRHARSDEVWRAYFYISHSRWNSSNNGVILDHDPTIGMGFGAAMHRQFRRVSTDASNIRDLYSKISPEVWIEFGQQIERGHAWELIESSIKPKPPRDYSKPVRAGSDYTEEMVRVHQRYMRNKQWH